jgi:hypothetical protein
MDHYDPKFQQFDTMNCHQTQLKWVSPIMIENPVQLFQYGRNMDVDTQY